ncbi:exodeoxyribonuclease VII small subunit [Psittacicella hinzii]|uniref:Exodeoxyribonuclease VII small subunit n=1 Tax=Psittacicella hinzii TaxID=2028575 RepID=A0A3A1YRA8_9GAMM|nr:exodeoxyribonuclease VII small subunit [Psittacicella hinzii]RIY40185.1 exodeoxyribonuclease VII small subunit [Psittacicella hinzii]
MSEEQALSQKPESFEEKIEKVKEIIKSMEGDQLSLQNLTAQYTEALTLVDELCEELNQASQKLEVVQQKRAKQ